MLSQLLKKKLEEEVPEEFGDYREIIIDDEKESSNDDDCNDDEDIVEETEEDAQKTRKRINTTRALSNESFYNGGMETEIINTMSIAISPLIESQYDYAVTDDPVQLQERKRMNEILYEIFSQSPFRHSYEDPETKLIKIPKEDIAKVFHYSKTHLIKRCGDISAREMLITINEFYSFDYNYIVKHIIGSRLYSEVLEEYYNDGLRSRIDESSAEPLF